MLLNSSPQLNKADTPQYRQPTIPVCQCLTAAAQANHSTLQFLTIIA
jgi:hypothetical protein